MKNLLAALLAASFAHPAAAAVAVPAGPAEMLVTVDWLKDKLADPKLVILHIGPKLDFEKEHIAGAQLVSGAELSVAAAEGALRLQLLPADALRARLQSLGISDDSRIVICFGADWVSPATRVFFSLEAAGLGRNTSLLDGGLNAWKAGGGAVTAKPSEPRAPGKITAVARPELVESLEDLQTDLAEKKIALLDARLPEFYSGANPGNNMPRAGHIPGAANIPFTSLLTEDGRFKSLGAIAAAFQDANVPPGGTVVSYCHIGQQATVLYFAARRLGLKARVYDGSWDEWSRRPEIPVEPSTTTPAVK